MLHLKKNTSLNKIYSNHTANDFFPYGSNYGLMGDKTSKKIPEGEKWRKPLAIEHTSSNPCLSIANTKY
jgi:hypothetical protein